MESANVSHRPLPEKREATYVVTAKNEAGQVAVIGDEMDESVGGSWGFPTHLSSLHFESPISYV